MAQFSLQSFSVQRDIWTDKHIISLKRQEFIFLSLFYIRGVLMKQTVFTGTACAIVTPFDENRKVDYKALKRQIDFQIENGADAIVVAALRGKVQHLIQRNGVR